MVKVEHYVYRTCLLVKKFNIPSCLVVNADETALRLMETRGTTYAKKGARKVHISGTGDKRQITAMTSISGNGKTLPFQLIFKGNPAKNGSYEETLKFLSHSKADQAALRSKIMNRGLLVSYSQSHWCTHDTLLHWVRYVLVPYMRKTHADLVELGARSEKELNALLVLDCYGVHTAQRFLEFMSQNYPWIHLVFVPKGTTSIAQPCDLVAQRPFKDAIRKRVLPWMQNWYMSPQAKGKKFPPLPLLREKILLWTLEATDDLQSKSELMRGGFEKAGLSRCWGDESDEVHRKAKEWAERNPEELPPEFRSMDIDGHGTGEVNDDPTDLGEIVEIPQPEPPSEPGAVPPQPVSEQAASPAGANSELQPQELQGCVSPPAAAAQALTQPAEQAVSETARGAPQSAASAAAAPNLRLGQPQPAADGAGSILAATSSTHLYWQLASGYYLWHYRHLLSQRPHLQEVQTSPVALPGPVSLAATNQAAGGATDSLPNPSQNGSGANKRQRVLR